MCKLQCLCPCRTSDGSSEYYAPLVKYVLRVRKKTMTPPLLENLPLPETLPPLEMTMTAGRQVSSLFVWIFLIPPIFSRRGLIWDALETWARPSQDTVIRNMQWDEQKNYSDQWTRSIRPPQAKSVWCSEALWQVYKIYKLCCHGPGIKSVVTNRLLIATVAHNIFLDRYAKYFFWIEMQNNSSSNLSPSLFGIEIQLSFQYFLCIEYIWCCTVCIHIGRWHMWGNGKYKIVTK